VNDRFILNKWFDINYNSILVIKNIYSKPTNKMKLRFSKNLLNLSIEKGINIDITAGYKIQSLIITYPLKILSNYIEGEEMINKNKEEIRNKFKCIDIGTYLNTNRYRGYKEISNAVKSEQNEENKERIKLLDIRTNNFRGVRIYTDTYISLISNIDKKLLENEDKNIISRDR